jgi:hypothetical protein
MIWSRHKDSAKMERATISFSMAGIRPPPTGGARRKSA